MTINVRDTSIQVGNGDDRLAAACDLAEAVRMNAKAILEIARALQPPSSAVGLQILGVHGDTPWSGQGFYGTAPKPATEV